MINQTKRICAVIVTYNRINYLKRLLSGLLGQTYKLDGILIVNNNSTDETEEELIKLGFCNSKVDIDNISCNNWNNIECYYLKKSINDGGAGGFYSAFKASLDLNYDYIWVMDDDVLPDSKCLELLIKNITEDSQVCIPNRSDNNFGDVAIIDFDLSNPFKYYTRRKNKIHDLKKNTILDISDMPFEGPLFSMEIIKKVGLPKKEFFIFCDDTEYALRTKVITNIKFITDAKLKKMIIPKNEGLMNWRAYYAYRNSIALDRLYGKNLLVKYISPILLWGEYTTRALLKAKFKNVKILSRAFFDGYFLRLGKRVNPGEF